MFASALIGLAIGAGVGLGGGSIWGAHQVKEYGQDAQYYADYNKAIKQAGLEGYSVKDIITRLHSMGYLSDAEYKDSLDSLSTLEGVYSNPYNDMNTLAWSLQSDDSRIAAQNLLTKLTVGISKIENSDYDTVIDYIKNTSSGGANAPSNSIAYAPTPTYDDVNFEGYQMDVDPVKLWTGPELAEHHNIDYDPNLFYDLIKKGTTAEVDRAMFESALMNEASMINDTANVTSYLDNIRNTRAEAISTGATAGAQAAAEVLHNKEAINNYAQNQAAVADARFNAVNNALLADSQAKAQANDYFSNLATTLGQDILTLYANDTSRYGQQVLSNSDLYKADQELRGQRAYNNASMYANMLQANSAIAGYKQQANQQGDEYAWMFNTFLRNNNNNVDLAVRDMDSYLYSLYSSGYTNRPDFYMAKTNH